VFTGGEHDEATIIEVARANVTGRLDLEALDR